VYVFWLFVCANKYYDGEYYDDKPHGTGIRYYDDGGRYEGDFKEGVETGKGIMYYQMVIGMR